VLGRPEHGHVFGGPAWLMLQHFRDLHKKNVYSFYEQTQIGSRQLMTKMKCG
jgi:hypothetical protein